MSLPLRGDTVVVNGIAIPESSVRDRMFKLNIYHFGQVKANLAIVDYPIRNMQKYIFCALYNSLATLDDGMGNSELTSMIHVK